MHHSLQMHSYSKKLKTQPQLQWEHGDELRQHLPKSFQTRYSFLKTVEFLILFTKTSKSVV